MSLFEKVEDFKDAAVERMDMMAIGAMIHTRCLIRRFAETIVEDEEGADMVEMIIGMAIIAGVAVFVTKLIAGAITNKGSQAAQIIESAAY